MSSSSSLASSSAGSAMTLDNSPPEMLSILQPLAYTSAHCGYCADTKGTRSTQKTGRSYGCWAHAMSSKTYKDLIDRGWRRSGKYIYKPDMAATCCPQYTISLDPEAFATSKSQRQLLHRFNTFVMEGGREGAVGWGRLESDPVPHLDSGTFPAPSALLATSSTAKPERTVRPDSLLSRAISVTFNPSAQPTLDDDEDNGDFLAPSSSKRNKRLPRNPALPPVKEGSQATASENVAEKGNRKEKAKEKAKAKATHPTDLVDLIHEPEWSKSPPDRPFKHRFEYVLEEASFTDEKYELFRTYQTQIHNEPDAKVTPKGFRRFLVDTPLDLEPSPHPLHQYGSFHGKYILDGVLIAFAVLDILPGAVSSVYFVWSPAYAAMGLGKVSALREASMVREMKRDGLEDMDSYMMGFYIHSCPKMRYKAEYQPSSLLDPATNEFYPWAHCKRRLDLDSHASFSRPLNPSPSPPSAAIPIPGSEPTALNEARESTSRVGTPASGMEVESEEEDEVQWPDHPPPGCLDPGALPKSMILGTCLLEGRTLVPLMFSAAWHDAEREEEIRCCLAALGEGFEGRIALWIG